MNAPAECKDCAGLMRCTSSGEETDRCVNTRNPHGFVSAAICKTMGCHETPQAARARSVHDQNARTRAALLATREEFTAEQVARQALMVRRAA